MELDREEMVAAMLAGDARYDGRFITGVLTTGIYCLPSCRGKKPKPENVRFFGSGADAQAAGLRACKRCRPDEFERGEDSELACIESVVRQVRSEPWRFKTIADVADLFGYGATKLHESIRQAYHRTPGEILTDARIRFAKNRLLEGQGPVSEIAFECGFETLSAFNDNFRRLVGMTPTAYRALAPSEPFEMRLPGDLDTGSILRSAGREPASPTDRVCGSEWSFGARLLSKPARIEVTFDGPSVCARVVGETIGREHVAEGQAVLGRRLGMDQDAGSFERQAVSSGFERLVAKTKGLRIVQTPDLADGLIWSIVGQQVTLAFAYTLRKRLIEAYGEPVGAGLFAVPSLDRLSDLDPRSLIAMQFSARKAEYLISAAANPVFAGDALCNRPAPRVEQALLGVRGLGPWAVNYLMMRSLGFMDCVPYGDTGLLSGLVRLYGLSERPDVTETKRLMEPFAPYRSLATAHLWQLPKEVSHEASI